MDKSKLILGGILKTIGATGTVAVDRGTRGMVPKKKPTGDGCSVCGAVHRAAAMHNAAMKRFAPRK